MRTTLALIAATVIACLLLANEAVSQPANEHSGGTGNTVKTQQTGHPVDSSHMRNEQSGRAQREYGINQGGVGRPHYNVRVPWLRRCTWQWHEGHRRRVCL